MGDQKNKVFNAKFRSPTDEELIPLERALQSPVYQALERMHGHMLEAGAVVTAIHVTQSTHDKLVEAFREVGSEHGCIIGCQTKFGRVMIKIDEHGVEL